MKKNVLKHATKFSPISPHSKIEQTHDIVLISRRKKWRREIIPQYRLRMWENRKDKKTKIKGIFRFVV